MSTKPASSPPISIEWPKTAKSIVESALGEPHVTDAGTPADNAKGKRPADTPKGTPKGKGRAATKSTPAGSDSERLSDDTGTLRIA